MRVTPRRPWWKAGAVGLLLLFLVSAGSVSAGDPVPGIDISLEQIPPGRVRTTTTDARGDFLFDRVPPGRYVLRAASPGHKSVEPLASAATEENHNVKRYILKPQTLRGIQEFAIEIIMSNIRLPGKDPGIPITVGDQGARISGHVTQGAAEREGDDFENRESSPDK